MSTRSAAFLLSLVAAASIAACSSGTGGAASGAVTVTDAWARPSTGMDMASAAYLTITNGTAQDDALLSVATPAAGSPEIHESSADASGMMAMHPVDRVEIPAGQTVTFQPGGFHVMLNDLTADLTVGATIELTLTFEKAGDIQVTATVRAS